MPLAIRMPGARRGAECHSLVSHTDIAATILDACGAAQLPGAGGKSLLPLLEDPAASVHSHVLAGLERHTYCRPGGAGYPCRSLRTAEYLYIRNFEPDRWPTGGPEFVSSNKTLHGDIDGAPTKDVLLSGRFPVQYQLCAGKRPAEELYHVESDPRCVRNLAAERSAVTANLRTILESELRATRDPRIDGASPWEAYPYRQTIGFGASFNTTLPAPDREAFREGREHKPE